MATRQWPSPSRQQSIERPDECGLASELLSEASLIPRWVCIAFLATVGCAGAQRSAEVCSRGLAHERACREARERERPSTHASSGSEAGPVATSPAEHKDVSWGLVIGGSAAFALSYVPPLLIAAQYHFHNSGGWFVAPVIGPWGYLAARKGCATDSDEFSGSICSFGNTMLVMAVGTDGLMQLAGAAMLVVGLVANPGEPVDSSRMTVRPTAVRTQGGGWMPGIAGSF